MLKNQHLRVRVLQDKRRGQRPHWCSAYFNRCFKDVLTAKQVLVKVGARVRGADLGSVYKAACNHTTVSDPELWIATCWEHFVFLQQTGRWTCCCSAEKEKSLHVEPFRRKMANSLRNIDSSVRTFVFSFLSFFLDFLSLCPLPESELSRDSFGITLSPDCWKTEVHRILTLAQPCTML